MRDYRISGNTDLNALLNRALRMLCEEDQRRFLKHFRRQPDDSDQIMHTARELIMGAYLASNEFTPRYSHTIKGQTPDWTLVDSTLQPMGILDVMTFHIDKETENEIEQQRQARRLAVYWRDANKNNVDRLRQRIADKAAHYRDLAEDLTIPYIVAVFADYRASLDKDDIAACLFDGRHGLFKIHQQLSGVLCFSEQAGQYAFKYTPNPEASWSLSLPNAVFPPSVRPE